MPPDALGLTASRAGLSRVAPRVLVAYGAGLRGCGPQRVDLSVSSSRSSGTAVQLSSRPVRRRCCPGRGIRAGSNTSRVSLRGRCSPARVLDRVGRWPWQLWMPGWVGVGVGMHGAGVRRQDPMARLRRPSRQCIWPPLVDPAADHILNSFWTCRSLGQAFLEFALFLRLCRGCKTPHNCAESWVIQAGFGKEPARCWRACWRDCCVAVFSTG